MEGLILEIQRMSTEDGPGLRTTVFLKGCPLSCAWCHNPESLSPRPQVQWVGSRCIGCRLCLAACPRGALSVTDGAVAVDRGRCQGCGACAAECPAAALERLGTAWEAARLVEELARDRAFFETSGGGITLSGGEPTLQPRFTGAVLAGARAQGLHTALDTCGLCTWETLEELLPHTDLLLYDVKDTDPVSHRAWTGADTTRILDNLRRAAALAGAAGRPGEIWVRTPLIPGATAREETVRGVGAFLATLPRAAVTRWELCAFNNLCRDKYRRLGLAWPWAHAPLLEEDAVGALVAAARASGVDPARVHATGSTRIPGDVPMEGGR